MSSHSEIFFPFEKGFKVTDPIKRRGGARPEAGRPPSQPAKLDIPATKDPLIFLLSVMNDLASDARLRIVAATAALPYVHERSGNVQGGKKDRRADAAQEAGKGKFAPSKPPKLKLINPTGE